MPVAVVGSLTLHVVLVVLSVLTSQSANSGAIEQTHEISLLEAAFPVSTVVTEEPPPPPEPEATPRPTHPMVPRILGAPVRPSDLQAAASDSETNDEPPGDDSAYDDAGGGEVIAVDAESGQGSSFSVRSGSGTGSGIGRAVRKGPSKAKPSVYTVGGVDTPPTVLSSARPPYPRSAERRGIEGWARVSLLITAGGHVAQARVLATHGHKSFGAAVLASIKSWTFRPATLDGQAVAVWATRTVSFKMPRRR